MPTITKQIALWPCMAFTMALSTTQAQTPTATWAALRADLSAPVQTIGLHLQSRHEGEGYNNDNLGAYVHLTSGFTAGVYRNSDYKPSFYAGYTYSRGYVSLTPVLVTGYRDCPLPTVIPSVAIALSGGVSARVSFVYSPERSSALHLSLEF